MKKSKFIAGALVLSMGLLGTGYAYWTDALSVNATVSTGEMNVEYADARTMVLDNDKDAYVEGLRELKRDKKNLEFNFKNMYPGASAGIGVVYKNSGTIGVKLDEVVVANDLAEKEIKNSIKFLVVDGVTDVTDETFATDGVTVDELPTKIEEFITQEELKPEATKLFYILAQMDTEVTGDIAENEEIGLDIELKWNQFNQ